VRPWRFVLGLIDSELGGIKSATRLLLPAPLPLDTAPEIPTGTEKGVVE
jgi:hypothetical protein